MKHLKLFITSLILAAGLIVPVVASSAVSYADTAKNEACSAIGGGANCSTDTSGGLNITDVFKSVINILSFVVGIVAVIMIIIAGFKYVTSNGDSNGISSAKNTLIYAIVGIIIVAFSQAIVFFVLNKIGVGKK